MRRLAAGRGGRWRYRSEPGEIDMKTFARIDGRAGREARRPSRLAKLGIVTVLLTVVGWAQPSQAKPYGYVFDDASGAVSIFDPETQQVIVRVAAGLRIRWFSGRFFDGKRVWAVDGDPKKAEVVVFDPRTLETVKRIPFGKGPSFSVELTPDNRYAIAAAAGSDQVVVIDTASYDIVRRIPVGRFPCDLTLSADGSLAYEPDRDQDTVSVVDWRNGKVLHTVAFPRGSKPHMLTRSPDGRQLWVQEREAGRVAVIDTKSLERIASVKVGRRPATNEFSPDGRFTLTTHLGDRVVKVFDAASLREIATIPVGKSPVNSVFRPDGRFVYVTNRGSGTVSVIDTGSWSVVKTIETGPHPFGIMLLDAGAS